ncbi:MAG: M15 family metallopeptidase [Candidatus Nitrosotenuis sp.]
MINSRSLDELLPVVKDKVERFISVCKENHIDLLVTSTYRDMESQAALYAQGRTTPGKKVTNAKPGFSFHNWRCAVDIVPLRNGKPVWGTKPGPDLDLWNKVGELGESVGLEWAGRWKSFREFAHFQYTAGLTLKDLQAGKHIS